MAGSSPAMTKRAEGPANKKRPGLSTRLAALVYAINRCTSADSLEYVKSAS